MNREYRVPTLAMVKDIVVCALLLGMLLAPLVMSEMPKQVAIPWWCVVAIVAALLGFSVYKQFTLSYTVDDQGITIHELRCVRRVTWEELEGLRRLPFYPDVDIYELRFKDGSRKRLNPQVGREFYADLRRFLPDAPLWWDPE